MNEEYGFEYLTDDNELNTLGKYSEEETLNNDKNEFVNGLPDWDLEPPHELVRRKDL